MFPNSLGSRFLGALSLLLLYCLQCHPGTIFNLMLLSSLGSWCIHNSLLVKESNGSLFFLNVQLEMVYTYSRSLRAARQLLLVLPSLFLSFDIAFLGNRTVGSVKVQVRLNLIYATCWNMREHREDGELAFSSFKPCTTSLFSDNIYLHSESPIYKQIFTFEG